MEQTPQQSRFDRWTAVPDGGISTDNNLNPVHMIREETRYVMTHN